MERQIAEIDAVDAELNAKLQSAEAWAEWKRHWSEWKQSAANANPSALAEDHLKLIDEALALISRIGDTSKLILDPDLDSYYLMDATVLRLPERVKIVGTARDHGEKIAATGDTSRANAIRQSVDGTAAALNELLLASTR